MSAPPPFADTSPPLPPEDGAPPDAGRSLVPARVDAGAAAELVAAPPVGPAAAAQAWELPGDGEDSAITSLQRAMLGPLNTAHYLPVFARFEAADRAGPGWNWAASLCTLNWLVFRRLWGPLLAYLGALAGGALLVFGIGRTVLQLSPSEEVSLLVAMGTIAFLVPGGLGDAWLYRQYRRRSAEALAAAPTLQEACALLARQASSRQRLLGMVVGNVALAAAALTGWSMWPGPGHGSDGVARVAAVEPTRRATGTVVPAPTEPPRTTASEPDMGATTPAPVAPPPSPSLSPPPDAVPPPGLRARPTGETPPPADLRGTAPQVRIVVAPPPAGAPPAADGDAPGWYPRPEAMQAYVTRYRQPPDAPAAVASAADAAARSLAGAASLPASPAQRPSPAITAKRPVAAASAATAGPASAARAAEPAAGGRYVINVGLFADPANAQRVLAVLRGAKVRVLVEELDMPNGRRTRVRAGPFATRAQADAQAARIRALKLDAVVVRQ